MPNRMLRDWTASDRVNSISVNAERFFVRLIMKVDDYGCFYADPRLLKSNLFPLLDSVRSTDIPRLIAECKKAGLIATYEHENKAYLQILDFRQRLDKARSKFPLPDFQNVNKFPEIVNEFPAEVEVETEVELEVEKEKREKRFTPPSPEDVLDYMMERLDDFTAMAEAKKFINFYESNGWKVGKNQMKKWKSSAAGWIDRIPNYSKNLQNGKLGTSEARTELAKNW